MAKQSPFFRWMSLSLVALLLTLSAGGSAWHVAAPAKQGVAATQKAGKATDHGQDAVIKSATFEAVVTSAVPFAFVQSFFLLPPVTVWLPAGYQPTLRRELRTSYRFFSYFRYVFGHHIAPNAP